MIDVRVPPPGIPIATGRKRSGRRLLTVGTDCALGKKYTALALARAFAARGVPTDFRATGQTGIMIAGAGIPMDAVVADFEAGAAEMLSPDAPPDHWDVIEGQGSLFHPSYACVSLGLLHGSQPDVIVVCHEPGRTGIVGLDAYRLPGLVRDGRAQPGAGPTHQPRDSLRRDQPEYSAAFRHGPKPRVRAGGGGDRTSGGRSYAARAGIRPRRARLSWTVRAMMFFLLCADVRPPGGCGFRRIARPAATEDAM